MKRITIYLILAIATILPHSVKADKVAQYWLDARAKWNPVADRYIAGDKSALDEMIAALEACGGIDKCLPDSRTVTTAQAEASVIAVNIAWMYRYGKGGFKQDKEQSDNYYYLASRVRNPWGIYNYAAYLESQPNQDTGALQRIALMYAGNGGLVAGMLDAARIYDEKLDAPKSALYYYKLALEHNPTAKQKERALAAIGWLAPLVDRPQQPAQVQQTAPTPPPKPAPPEPKPVRTHVVETARQCISEIRTLEARDRKDEKAVQRVNKAWGSLNAEKNMLDINFRSLPQGGEGAFMRRQRDIQYDAYYRRLDQWNEERDRVQDSIDQTKRMLRSYNQKCVMEIEEAEYKQVCSNNSGNTFCRGFTNFHRNL